MDEQNTPPATSPTGSPIYQESQEKNAKWLWLLIILIIIAALVFAFYRGIGPFSQFRKSSQVAQTSPTPELVSSPTPEASSEASAIDKSKPQIRVLNGTGTAGVASSFKDFIEGLGYKVASIGNADSYDFSQTEVRFKENFKKYQDSLTRDLSDKYSVKVSSDDLESTDSADIEIIVGKK